MMVLPVGGSQGKKGKKGKKGGGSGDGVQVNLIVDSGLFDDGEDRDRDRRPGVMDEYGSDAYTIPGAWSSSHSNSGRGHRKQARPRRSIFVALAQEKQWKEARSWLKKLMIVDICGIFVWGGLFVFILMGKKCPIGQFNGW